MAGAISSVTINLSTIDFVWDVARDNPEALYKGRAAARLELDRLIKRIEKLNAEKRELEGKLSELNAELNTITHRVEELQRQ
jgi:chromosome segregation ATPase